MSAGGKAKCAHLDGSVSLLGHVGQQLGDEVDRVLRRGGLEDAAPGVGADLREAELLVVGVHALQLLLGGRAQHL